MMTAVHYLHRAYPPPPSALDRGGRAIGHALPPTPAAFGCDGHLFVTDLGRQLWRGLSVIGSGAAAVPPSLIGEGVPASALPPRSDTPDARREAQTTAPGHNPVPVPERPRQRMFRRGQRPSCEGMAPGFGADAPRSPGEHSFRGIQTGDQLSHTEAVSERPAATACPARWIGSRPAGQAAALSPIRQTSRAIEAQMSRGAPCIPTETGLQGHSRKNLLGGLDILC